MTHTKYLKKKIREKMFLSRGNSHFCKKILHFLSSELKISGFQWFPTVEISIQPGDTINRATCERISVLATHSNEKYPSEKIKWKSTMKRSIHLHAQPAYQFSYLPIICRWNKISLWFLIDFFHCVYSLGSSFFLARGRCSTM